MVNEGDTLILPDALVMPMRLFTPLSIVIELAPLVIQVSVAVPPEGMLDGETNSVATGREPVGGGAALPTDIVVLA